MEKPQLIEWKGFIVAAFVFLLCMYAFLRYSANTYYSFLAALITGFIAWGTYFTLRVLLFALTRDD